MQDRLKRPSRCEDGSKEPPRQAMTGLKSDPRGLKKTGCGHMAAVLAPRGPKMAPRPPQDGLERLQYGPKRLQKSSELECASKANHH